MGRRWVLKIHLYGGLICFWYFLIFAISSIHYHHHFPLFDSRESSEWTESFQKKIYASATDSAIATTVRDDLGIAGWYLPWKTHRDSAGFFHTEIQNFKGNYVVTYDFNTASATVEKTDRGFWGIVNALHGFAGKMPNAPLMILWTAYTYLCLVVVIFSIFSGVWLWVQSRSERRTTLLIFVSAICLSVFLIMMVYVNG